MSHQAMSHQARKDDSMNAAPLATSDPRDRGGKAQPLLRVKGCASTS